LHCDMSWKMSATVMTSIARQLKQVTEKVTTASLKRPDKFQYVQPRLVAVSKTKSVDMIIEAYDAGQRHFGENYVGELIEKANDIELQDHCEDIRWHFIGHLQKNKVSKLLEAPNLFAVETVDSDRLAKAVNDSLIRKGKKEPLNIMIQVNTSGEQNKSGCPITEAVQLVGFVRDECPKLRLMGLMTIGAYGYDPNSGPNPDFKALFNVREEVCKAYNIPVEDMELSMGMSTDFEQAIEMGSTNVRIGSTIFGGRTNSSTPTTKDSTDTDTTEMNQPNRKSQDTLPGFEDASVQLENVALS